MGLWKLLFGQSESSSISPSQIATPNIGNIKKIDLQLIIERLVTKRGWDKEKAIQIANEYRQFLLLWALSPGELLIPWSVDLDDFWHEHILFTEKYHNDCQLLAGKYLHHTPGIEKGTDKHTRELNKTSYLRGRMLERNVYRALLGLSRIEIPKPQTRVSGQRLTSSSRSQSQSSTGDAGVMPIVMSGGSSIPCDDGGSASCGDSGSSCGGSSCGSSCGGGGCGGD